MESTGLMKNYKDNLDELTIAEVDEYIKDASIVVMGREVYKKVLSQLPWKVLFHEENTVQRYSQTYNGIPLLVLDSHPYILKKR